jgi:hypothetical protein
MEKRYRLIGLMVLLWVLGVDLGIHLKLHCIWATEGGCR